MKTRKENCSILPLVLKAKWYDLIASGEKKEEYRESKPYWKKRIQKWLGEGKESDCDSDLTFQPRVVTFSRGYRKAGMAFLVEKVEHRVGLPTDSLRVEWGEPNIPHYAISLGEKVELED